MRYNSSLPLSLICTTVFGVLISAHGATVVGGYEYPDNIKTLQYADGALTNSGRTAVTIACAAPLTPGTRLTWAVRLPPQGSLTITTGRGRESLALVNRGEHLQWTHTSPEGYNHKRRPYATGSSDEHLLYWWENDSYTPRGRTSPSFALPPALRDWNAYYQARQNVDIAQEWWPVAVELADGRLRWYLDDILLQDQEATAEIGGRKLQLRLGQGAALHPVTVSELGPARPGFYHVNLANRYNAAAPLAVTRGAPFEFGGIPFEVIPAREGGLGCVDLGASWFREGNLDSGDAPNSGTFGGRWAGALSANPTRIQFRVPNGNYDAIYLLASCEARPDRVSRVTAQFYRPGSGFPQNFVPAEPIATDGRLQLLRIPINSADLLQLADREVIEIELCGDVHVYRASPDPLHYSMHGGGIPSGVQVYAMTLSEVPVTVTFDPEAFGNIWVADMNPAYKATLHNRGRESQKLELSLETTSYDGHETTLQQQQLELQAGESITTRFDLALQQYGWHEVLLKYGDQVHRRSLVILRRREHERRPFDARGFMFGIWSPGRTHYTLSAYDTFRLAGPLGIESISHNGPLLEDTAIAALPYGLKNFEVSRIGPRPRDHDVPDLAERLRDTRVAPSKVSEPSFQYLFAEPGGIGSAGVLPEFYGEPPLQRTPQEEERFVDFRRMVTNFSQHFRAQYPGKKILMPWGNPLFAIPFLQDPATREAFDGVGFDTAFFDRLPEMQAHQCSLHAMMLQFNHYWYKCREDPPLVVTVEGPCLGGVKPGALTVDQHAAHLPRAMLTMMPYGVNRFFASVSGGPENCSYWGEQHYGGGAFTRVTLDPYPAYATQGTLICHLRHMEFVRAVPTGSLSTFCYQFKDARDDSLLHILWTIRGRRAVKMSKTQAYDSMDNLISGDLVLGQLPVYVYGSDGTLELGAPDHSDVQLAADKIDLGAMADLFTRQNQEADDEYLNSFPRDIRRFPAAMQVERVAEGLAITLPTQPVDRGLMPFYTTLQPEKPLVIPGKAQYLTVEVSAASDWGRIVYVLRDAKGERWISVGTKDSYNNDDTPNASYFNFDGRRLVRFELPSNLPWDNYREMGSTWWGAYDGDKVADMPLAIEKIHIERRPQAIYGNRLEPTDPAPVVFGKLYAEYAGKELMSEAPHLVMPPPPAVAEPYNPVRELAASATLPAGAIEKVTEPEHYYDGTRGHFHFKEFPEAVKYDIYLSLAPDGANAIKLGNGLKESGALVRGFLAGTDFYAFVIYYDKAGRHSHPSAPFKLRLEDKFANK